MSNATTSAEWDAEYRDGRWDFLRGVKESGRYGILTGWLMTLGAARSVLDVGCGEGLFWRNLAPLGPEKYVGVDLSTAAFERAAIGEAAASVRLEAADLHDFSPAPDERFSAIIFNEVLYFSEEPEVQLARYAGFLEEGGVIAVSMYAPKRGTSGANKSIARVWNATDRWDVLDDLALTSAAKDVTWKLRLVRP